ncbi:DUF2147 domain-containing protein [Leptobacterium flavescens]|uniref:DUF2147 domain-containing protein n=1 Tax=Leptobacterium flavescens TaxID=472055 RepID=A0A6P0UHM5_9FLAO|nr:DUF2147 domain-containing protein [Leptobacterium flavescens]NER11950.1 DUF2147 domain-containing protein [Leptobacterium flavescens]
MNTLKITTAIISVLFLGAFHLNAQEITGKWKTVDDETGETKSVVEIYEKDGKVYGKIVEILNKNRQNAVCGKCPEDDYRKDKPVLGMVIINGLKKSGKEYKGGKILDPHKGKEYKCKLWIDESDSDKLNVRGYIAFLYRTQNWYRVE